MTEEELVAVLRNFINEFGIKRLMHLVLIAVDGSNME